MSKAKPCSVCGSEEETRPYGKGGAYVCFPCGTAPERIEETKRQMDRRLEAAGPVVIIGGEDGPV